MRYQKAYCRKVALANVMEVVKVIDLVKAFNSYHSVSDTKVAENRVWGLVSSGLSVNGDILRNKKYFVLWELNANFHD